MNLVIEPFFASLNFKIFILNICVYESKTVTLDNLSLLLLYIFLAVGGQVTLNMEDTIEVYLGDSATIHCKYSFAEQPSMLMVQWFVVSTVLH